MDARVWAEAPLWIVLWWAAAAVIVAVVIAGGALAMWLLGVWSPIPAGVPDPSRLRLERIKTGLTVAAGLAAGVTLLMALRRQAWSERAQRFAESDALEQRTTTLYVAAADQLGSEKAAVRLAGLYALERLGQDNPKLRQTVMEVQCAYLRMPYAPPAEVLRDNVTGSPHTLAADAEVPEPEEQPQRRQELQVRLTAQRLLANHLRLGDGTDVPDPDSYWRGPAGEWMNLDLAGATLVEFDLSGCHAGRIALTRAQFHGNADLTRAQFHGNADLSGAQFHGEADLTRAQFHEFVSMHEARFHGNVRLHDAQFHAGADLGRAQFHGYANLDRAQFHRYADLTRAQFHGYANLEGVQFHGITNLSDAQFHGDVDLDGALVTRDVHLPPGWVSRPPDPAGLRLVERKDARPDPLAESTGAASAT